MHQQKSSRTLASPNGHLLSARICISCLQPQPYTTRKIGGAGGVFSELVFKVSDPADWLLDNVRFAFLRVSRAG